jgi:poly(3-hydroxybutyrate) depolymerase/chitodextrinase
MAQGNFLPSGRPSERAIPHLRRCRARGSAPDQAARSLLFVFIPASLFELHNTSGGFVMKYVLSSTAALGLASLVVGLGCGENAPEPRPAALGQALVAASAPSAASLGAYNADIYQTSVSGISSGGYMAVQLHVAYSSIMKGAGVFAGGPYHCAGSSGQGSHAQLSCQYALPAPAVSDAISYTDQQATAGAIDATSNLSGQKVWLFSGTKDNTVKQSVMNVLQQYYQHYVGAGNVFYKNDIAAGHAHITDNYGSACSSTQSPYINNCNYDGPGLLLAQIYGTLAARNTGTLSGQLISFDQSEFLASPGSKGMDDTGWVYVPAACADGSGEPCRVHIALHGCQQGQAVVGDKYYTHAGYNEWADKNRIIVLYPQAKRSSGNPLGCWDWWGYNDASNYATKSGDQMAAIKKMVDRLTSGHPALPAPTGLTAGSPTDHTVSLSWDSVSGAAGYDVYRATVAAGPFNRLTKSPQAGTSYDDSGLIAGTQYYYEVRAADTSGRDGAPSAVLSVTTTGHPPAVPTPAGLAVTATTGSTVTLQWDAATDVSGYNLFRGTSAGNETTRVNSSLISGTSYTDSGLAAQMTYYYTVKAQNSAGVEGPASAEVSTTTAASVCFKDNNWNHYRAGRAKICGGNTCALGSGQNMGLLSVATVTSLKQTGPSYYVIGTCP